MSPSSVVIVSSPPSTAYLDGLSRTIAFQRDLSSAEPSNWSSRLGPADPPPSPPPTPAPSSRNQSKSATGEVVAALLNANMPSLDPGFSGAGRPTGGTVLPSGGEAPVM